MIKNLFNEAEEYIKFFLKNQDRVFFDAKHQTIKLTFDLSVERRDYIKQEKAKVQHKVKFTIDSKNIFSLFIRKIKMMNFLSLQLVEFDCFNDQFVD